MFQGECSFLECKFFTESGEVKQGKKRMQRAVAAFFMIFGVRGALRLAGTIGIFYKNRCRVSTGIFWRGQELLCMSLVR
jgi:hypothetical protein